MAISTTPSARQQERLAVQQIASAWEHCCDARGAALSGAVRKLPVPTPEVYIVDVLRESPDIYIKQVDGQLRVEAARFAGDVAAIYRDLAVLCIEKQIRRVLVK